MPDGTASAHRYWPKLATTFAEGYGFFIKLVDRVIANSIRAEARKRGDEQNAVCTAVGERSAP